MSLSLARCHPLPLIPEQPTVSEQPRFSDFLLLAALPTAASSARSFVISTLTRWQAPLAIEDAAMLATELVMNAVRATGVTDPAVKWERLDRLEVVEVRLHGLRRSIVMEVWDADPYPSLPGETSHVDNPLLDTLGTIATRWGTRPTARGKVVWAELPLYESAESGLPIRRRNPMPYPHQPSAPPADMELLERVLDGLKRLQS